MITIWKDDADAKGVGVGACRPKALIGVENEADGAGSIIDAVVFEFEERADWGR